MAPAANAEPLYRVYGNRKGENMKRIVTAATIILLSVPVLVCDSQSESGQTGNSTNIPREYVRPALIAGQWYYFTGCVNQLVK